MPISRIGTDGIEAGAVAPSDLSTGAPYWDGSGNVGIGTSSPATKAEVYGTAAANNLALRITNTATDGFSTLQLGDANAGIYRNGSAQTQYAGANSLNLITVGAHNIGFATNNTERARIDSSGNFRVGDANYNFTAGASGQSRVTVNNDYCFQFTRKNGTGVYVYFTYNTTDTGTISTNGTTTSYNTSSDYRLKENVQPMTGALAKVAALKPCTYTWKDSGIPSQGFVAHELAEVVPECVTGEKDAVNEDGSIKPQGIDTSFLVATLTAAIQEQQQMIETLQAKVAALEAK